MQEDFHYYATYCAAYLAGYSPDESLTVAYSAQLVDCCSRMLLKKLGAPLSAATTQLKAELADAGTDMISRQDITRIWSSFHFLPRDLYAKKAKRPKRYMQKYRLICDTNSDLLVRTVELAKNKSLQACGLAMHVLADTWAHRYFAGTPSFAINDADGFREIRGNGEQEVQRMITFRHNPVADDDTNKNLYTNCLRQDDENSVMNLGHGRAGHLPDYSFIKYIYMPAWRDYKAVVKDNPKDYYRAFAQMVYAMKYLRGVKDEFVKDRYDEESVPPFKDKIMEILSKRRLNACKDWENFAASLTGEKIEAFDVAKYQAEYMRAPEEIKEKTFLGKFIIAALAQKSMVTNQIFQSGNLLAGFSVNFEKSGFKGIKDFKMLIKIKEQGV